MTDPVYLPAVPRARVLQPRYMDAGGVLQGSHGGAHQPISRLGDRWGLSVQLPEMRWGGVAENWVNKLLQGVISKRVAFQFYLPNFKVGTPGSPLVNGAVAGGSSIPVRGAQPNYDFQAFQFISIIHLGRRYLHWVTAQTVADAAGAIASLPIQPMLRINLSDGDVIEAAEPYIEGMLSNEGGFDWSIDEARHTGLQFSIIETS